MRLDKVFNVKNGIPSADIEIKIRPSTNTIALLRPSKSQQRTITGWVSKIDVGENNIYPKDTIFVSTNGEGSHTYAYVSRFDFACNSDVSVLIPKNKMSLNEKIFFTQDV